VSVDFNASFSGSAETFGAKMTETPASLTAPLQETGGGLVQLHDLLVLIQVEQSSACKSECLG